MSKFPEDDERLVEFLRQHAGTPPPAAPNLEVQIMQAVASLDRQQTPRRRHLWVVPPAIAAAVLIAWGGYRFLVPPAPPDAALEAFMKDNWDSVVVGEGIEVDWLQVN